MPFNLGGPELIIILVIVLIVFGAGKLPSVMRDVGKGVKEFKNAQSEEEGVATTSQSTAAPPPPAASPAGTASTNGSTTVAHPSEPAPRA
jgi:sec-independent protein translocase protein TatA